MAKIGKKGYNRVMSNKETGKINMSNNFNPEYDLEALYNLLATGNYPKDKSYVNLPLALLERLIPGNEAYIDSFLKAYGWDTEIDKDKFFGMWIANGDRIFVLPSIKEKDGKMVAKVANEPLPIHQDLVTLVWHFANKCWYIFPKNKPEEITEDIWDIQRSITRPIYGLKVYLQEEYNDLNQPQEVANAKSLLFSSELEGVVPVFKSSGSFIKLEALCDNCSYSVVGGYVKQSREYGPQGFIQVALPKQHFPLIEQGVNDFTNLDDIPGGYDIVDVATQGVSKKAVLGRTLTASIENPYTLTIMGRSTRKNNQGNNYQLVKHELEANNPLLDFSSL